MAKKNNPKPFSSLLGLFLIGLLIFGGFNLLQKTFFTTVDVSSDNGAVLSSGKGSDGDEEEEDDDDDDDEDNSGSGSSHDDDDEDDNSGSGSSDEEEDEDNSGPGNSDDEEEEEEVSSSGRGSAGDIEEDDDDEETKTREIVENSDGTTSEITREIEGDEEKVRIKTFNAQGNKIGDRRLEREEGEEEVRVKTYDGFGTKLSDLRLETEDGKKLELRVKEGESEVSRVKYNVDNQTLEVRTGDDEEEEEFSPEDIEEAQDTGEEPTPRNRLRIRARGDSFELSRAGVGVLANFPITIDDETGQIFVTTPVGDVELRAMPDSIVEKASLNQTIEEVDGVELQSDDDPVSEGEPELKYVVSGRKSERLLGIFNIDIPSQLIYDAQTGNLTGRDQGFTTRILDLFSF